MFKQKLIKTLQKEYQKYKELKTTAEKKQRALIDNDVNVLMSTITEEQDLLQEIEELEENRNKDLEGIVKQNDINLETDRQVSFNMVVELFSKEEKEQLKNIKEMLLGIFAELEDINEENKQLLEDSLIINRQSFNIIRETVKNSNTYSKPGENNDNNEHYIDCEA